MKYSIAIDQSTSSTKVLLINNETTVVDKETLPHKQHYPQAGWVEHDCNEIWQNLLAACATLIDRYQDCISDIEFVSITNQRETFVVFESETGKPVKHATVWQCNRGESVCEKFRNSPEAEQFKSISGLEIDTYFSGPKLKWLTDNDESIKQGLTSGQYRFGNIDTYLIYRLTRGEVYATDHTNASRTFLYDLRKRSWSPWLCEKFGISHGGLPDIRECDGYYGSTDFEGILPKCIPIHGVMGDSQAALFAQRCFDPGEIKVTLGTGSSMLYNIGNEAIDSQNGLVTSLASVTKSNATYCFEGIIRFSSATLDWLQKQLNLFEDILEAEAMATDVEDSAGVYLVPAFSGLGVPHWNAHCKAAIVGLTAHSDKRHIILAAFESMGWQIREAIELMEAETDSQSVCLNVDGGPSKSSFLMQLTADILQRDIEVNQVSECSAVGACMAGLLGTGLVGSIEDLKKLPRKTARYSPCKSEDVISKNYSMWKRAVRQVLT